MRYTEKKYETKNEDVLDFVRNIFVLVFLAPYRLLNEISQKIMYLRKEAVEKLSLCSIVLATGFLIFHVISYIITRDPKLIKGFSPILTEFVTIIVLGFVSMNLLNRFKFLESIGVGVEEDEEVVEEESLEEEEFESEEDEPLEDVVPEKEPETYEGYEDVEEPEPEEEEYYPPVEEEPEVVFFSKPSQEDDEEEEEEFEEYQEEQLFTLPTDFDAESLLSELREQSSKGSDDLHSVEPEISEDFFLEDSPEDLLGKLSGSERLYAKKLRQGFDSEVEENLVLSLIGADKL